MKCPKCGSETPIGHRCIVDDLAAIQNTEPTGPLADFIKRGFPKEGPTTEKEPEVEKPRNAEMRAFVAGWFAHARNSKPARLLVEDAWHAYRLIESTAPDSTPMEREAGDVGEVAAEDLGGLREVVEAAYAEVIRLCQRDERWRMSIPARLEAAEAKVITISPVEWGDLIRNAQANAWDEGYEAGSEDEANARYDLGANPYRTREDAP